MILVSSTGANSRISLFPGICGIKTVSSSYYHRFLPGLANKINPLHKVCSGKGQEVNWSSDCQTAFENAKNDLVNATMLHHPDGNCPLSISTDASDYAVGGSLDQFKNEP